MRSLRFDDPRVLTLVAATLATLLAWIALGAVISEMDMSMSMAPSQPVWSATVVAMSCGMWLLMMFAMMLPVMAPMLAAYADLTKRDPSPTPWSIRVTAFAAGYGLLWGAFSIGAGLLQLALRDSALLRMGGTLAAPSAAAGLLIVAGIYQWLPMKEACLRHCRSPMAFLLAHWRPGLRGAFRLGVRHGWFCLGCCIALMSLMFVFGTMAFWGMAALAAYCVAERLLPAAERWGRWVGAMLVAAGGAVLFRGAL